MYSLEATDVLLIAGFFLLLGGLAVVVQAVRSAPVCSCGNPHCGGECLFDD